MFFTEYLFQNVLTMAINKTFHFKVLPSQQVFNERKKTSFLLLSLPDQF